MTARHNVNLLEDRNEIVSSPSARACDDHSFELPPVLFGIMAALFFGFLLITAAGFAHPEMVVPMGINFIFLIAFFTVPTIFARVAPAERSRKMTWSKLMEEGIDTATGRTSGREAVVLILILPLLIFFWGVVVVAIAAAAR